MERKCLNIYQRKQSAGKPRNRYLDDIKNNLKRMCVKAGEKKKKTRDRDDCL